MKIIISHDYLLHSTRVPVPLHHALQAVDEQRRALHAAEKEGTAETEDTVLKEAIEMQKDAIKRQEEVVQKFRDTYQ